MASPTHTLRIGHAQGAPRYFLGDRALSGGDVVELCCSGGWLAGRFEADGEPPGRPTFFFSIEVEGGAVVEQTIDLPPRALLRWPR